MVTFPQINSAGVLTQRPYQAGLHYATSVVELPSGQRQQWGWRGMAMAGFPDRPLGKWELNYQAITEAECTVLREFFHAMRGRYGEFAYIDPNGNLVPNSEQFGDSSWSGSVTNSASGLADPFGGTRAMGAIFGSASCNLLPGGRDKGLVMCMSVWVKANSFGSVTIGLSGAGSTVHSLPANRWVRATHSGTVGTSAVTGSITLNTPGSIFGAQAVAMPGPGGYMRTPGNPGLHPKCRFDTDTFSPRYLGPNQISLKLPIVEYW